VILLSFITLGLAVFMFLDLVLESMRECRYVILSGFHKILWCKNRDPLGISGSDAKRCSRCGCQCSVIKF
jgi:hypothetical protein